MMKVLSICHAVLTLVLLALVIFLFTQHLRMSHTSDVVRVRRLEIVDQSGKTRAVMDTQQQNGERPELALLDNNGRQAVLIAVNSLGYATAYFQSKRTEGKVSVGYLWGSDSLTPDTEDPLARWGIRIRGSDGTAKELSLPENPPVTTH